MPIQSWNVITYIRIASGSWAWLVKRSTIQFKSTRVPGGLNVVFAKISCSAASIYTLNSLDTRHSCFALVDVAMPE